MSHAAVADVYARTQPPLRAAESADRELTMINNSATGPAGAHTKQ